MKPPYDFNTWQDLDDMFKEKATEDEIITFRQLFAYDMVEEVKDYMIAVLKKKL